MRVRRWAVLSLGLIAVCAWCGWVSGFHRSSTPALATWCISIAGVVVIDVLAVRGRSELHWSLSVPSPSNRPAFGARATCSPALLSLSPWLFLVAVIVVWEVLGIDTGPHGAHLTISALAQAYRAVNAALLFIWIFVGIGYGVTRARTPTNEPKNIGPTSIDGAVSSAGPVALALGAPPRLGAVVLPNSRAVGVVFWVVWVVACVLVDLAARFSGGRIATAEQALRFVSNARLAQLVLVAAWTFAGWHLFAY